MTQADNCHGRAQILPWLARHWMLSELTSPCFGCKLQPIAPARIAPHEAMAHILQSRFQTAPDADQKTCLLRSDHETQTNEAFLSENLASLVPNRCKWLEPKLPVNL